MEALDQSGQAKAVKPKPKVQEKPEKVSSGMKKLDAESSKLLSQLREKANKKAFGRKVRESEILGMALKLVEQSHISQLQEATYSERDRLDMAHAQYQKAHGKITLDAFIGKLMRGEIRVSETAGRS